MGKARGVGRGMETLTVTKILPVEDDDWHYEEKHDKESLARSDQRQFVGEYPKRAVDRKLSVE